MVKKSKFIYIIGSAVIGISALLIVFFALIAGGVINVRQNKLVFTSGTDNSFVYDGTAHFYREWRLSEGELKEGHEAIVTVSGSQTDVGSSENHLTAKIIDEGGADVTGDYEIEYQPGVITVLPREISITSANAEKVYDGEPLTAEQAELTEGTLVKGHSIKAEFSGTVSNAGAAVNYYTVHILNSRGNDKTANYKINCSYGILTVRPREITITSSGGEKEYDGEPLISDKSSVTSGSLIEGHECVVEVSGSITDVGTAKNSFTAVITDAEGNDITSNYKITKDEGELRVTRRRLYAESGSAEKEYDGEQLVYDSYEVGAGLLDGHICEVSVNGFRINAGTGKNTFTITVTDADGRDITSNYDIVKDEGELTVRPRTVTIRSQTAHKIYDGEALYAEGWEYASDKRVVAGHTLGASAVSYIIDKGSCANIIPEEYITVTDQSGGDVKGNYKITVVEGTLTVTPRPVAVRSDEDSKEYDGKPLTCGRWAVVSITDVVDGHDMEVKITGTQTEVGQSENFIAEVIVTDGNGKNVTQNYEIITQQGLLTVKGNSSGDGPDKDITGDLDDSGSFGGGSGSGQKLPAVKITSEVAGKVYLKYLSFGDYAFLGFDRAKEYGKCFTVDGINYGYNYLTSIALSSSPKYTSSRAVIEVLGTSYYLPYYTDLGSAGYDIQTSDVAYSGSYNEPYTLFYYLYDYVSDGAVYNSLGSYSQEEAEYRKFVYENYTAVPASTRSALESIASRFNKDDPEVIKKLARFVQTAAEYNESYDVSLDRSADVVVAFLKDYKQGVCRHYAGAATVLYRMIGIPARYAIGYVGNTVAGEEVTITTDKAHAWVEVYINGMGWVQVEVTGGSFADGNGSDDGSGNGGGGGQLEKLIIKPEINYVLYDGFTHTHDGRLQGLRKFVEEGYEYTARVSGSGVSPGRYDCVIEDFKIFYDGVEVTQNFLTEYNISLAKGTLQIYLYELDVTTGSGKMEYDGTALDNSSVSVSGELYSEAAGQLTNGDTIVKLASYGSITEVGETANLFEILIVDKDGNDVTYNYKINNRHGVLKVLARQVTLTADSAQKPFDGTPLTADGWKITDGSLAYGHEAVVTVSGSISGIGSAENRIVSVKIFDADGADVTKNYKVNTVPGTLNVMFPE